MKSPATPFGEIDQPYGFDTSGRFNTTVGYTYTYTANSHLLASIAHTSSGWTQTRAYLSNANILDVIETKFGATTKAKFDYTHDNLYRVITSAKTGELFSTYGNGTQGLETDYAYNDRSELTADSTALGGSSTPLTGRDDYHAYDPIGNRTSVNRSGTTLTFNSNSLNQYTSFTGSATHTYDDDGNLTNDGRWGYVWDAENRLVSQETLTGVTPKQRLEFSYDYLKRRVRKVVKDWGGGAWITSTDRKFIYDEHNLLLELNNLSSLAKVRAHIWGLDWSGSLHGAAGVGGLLYTYDYTTGTSLMPAYDGNGNATAYMNASGGALVAKYEFDAFGQTIVSSGTHTSATPFRFSTKYTDTESGLVQYNERYYSPSLGRFINRDPITEDGGLNLYAYCTNGPVTHYDYLGRMKRWHDGGGWTGGASQSLIGGAGESVAAVEGYSQDFFAYQMAVMRAEQTANNEGVSRPAIKQMTANLQTAAAMLNEDARMAAVLGGFASDLVPAGTASNDAENTDIGPARGPQAEYVAPTSGREGHYDAETNQWVYPDGRTASFGTASGELKFIEYDALTRLAPYVGGVATSYLDQFSAAQQGVAHGNMLASRTAGGGSQAAFAAIVTSMEQYSNSFIFAAEFSRNAAWTGVPGMGLLEQSLGLVAIGQLAGAGLQRGAVALINTVKTPEVQRTITTVRTATTIYSSVLSFGADGAQATRNFASYMREVYRPRVVQTVTSPKPTPNAPPPPPRS